MRHIGQPGHDLTSLANKLCCLGHHLIRSGLGFLELLNIRSKLGLLLHDKCHLAIELFVVHIHHEDLLSKVKESLAKGLPITKRAIQRWPSAAARDQHSTREV